METSLSQSNALPPVMRPAFGEPSRQCPPGNLDTGLVPDQDNPAEFMIKEYEDTDLLWERYQQGLLQAAYLPVDAVGNVLLLECDTLDQARKALNHLPAVASGLLGFHLTELIAMPKPERKKAQTQCAIAS